MYDRSRPSLPYAGNSPGIYQVCTDANTDYDIEIPANATGCVLWFETAAADDTLLGGRVAIAPNDTAIATLDNTDALMGYHPAMPVEYTIPAAGSRATHYLHVANATALAVVRGFWLFQNA